MKKCPVGKEELHAELMQDAVKEIRIFAMS